MFEPLIRSQIRDIVGLRAAALVARIAAQHITLKLGDSALEYLAAKVSRRLRPYPTNQSPQFLRPRPAWCLVLEGRYPGLQG